MEALKIKMLLIGLLAALVFMGAFLNSAMAADALYLCKPCSRDFIPEAQAVIDELGLGEQVVIKTTSCLGYCNNPVVLKFMDRIYLNMDGSKLKRMLMDVYDL